MLGSAATLIRSKLLQGSIKEFTKPSKAQKTPSGTHRSFRDGWISRKWPKGRSDNNWIRRVGVGWFRWVEGLGCVWSGFGWVSGGLGAFRMCLGLGRI